MGDCICNHNPETTDGPDECCPEHGRTYAEWIERGNVLQDRLDDMTRQRDEAVAEAQRLRRDLAACPGNVLWNQANLVGYAIGAGRLDGTNVRAICAAIRATNPDEFEAALRLAPDARLRTGALMTDQTWDDNTPSYRPNWRDRRDMAAAVEALARAICPRVSQPGYCDKCERAAEAILADPAPLLAALVEAGVLERAARQAEYGRVRDVYAARWKAPAD